MYKISKTIVNFEIKFSMLHINLIVLKYILMNETKNYDGKINGNVLFKLNVFFFSVYLFTKKKCGSNFAFIQRKFLNTLYKVPIAY